MSSEIGSLLGAVQAVTLAKQRFVILPEREYLRLCAAAAEDGPPMPTPDREGNYPAAEALQVSIARSILRQRRAARLSQAELARRAGIAHETLNRIERGKHAPGVATLDKIDRALKGAQATGKDRPAPPPGAAHARKRRPKSAKKG